jgi:uncharacterized protein
MAKIDTLVQGFLASKSIAVVGVSEKRDTGCNLAYTKFKDEGYKVFAVSPHITSFKGEPCYPDLKSIPQKPDAVFLLTNPKVTESVVRECVDLGIKNVWMHCMLGTKPGLGAGMTSVSPEAVKMCKDNGINVIPGACPNQFVKADFGHGMMRGLWGLLGFMKVE